MESEVYDFRNCWFSKILNMLKFLAKGLIMQVTMKLIHQVICYHYISNNVNATGNQGNKNYIGTGLVI